MDVIFLLAKAKETGGSFQSLRRRQAQLLQDQRHDRGWPHDEPAEAAAGLRDKKRWKTVGIVHIPDEDEDEDED